MLRQLGRLIGDRRCDVIARHSGLLVINDLMDQEIQNTRLEMKIRQHQIERQRILAQT